MAEHNWARLVSPSHPDMTGSISTFLLDGFGSTKLGDILFERHKITVPVSPQGSAQRVRVSTHIYNTFAQVNRLAEALEELHAEAAGSIQ